MRHREIHLAEIGHVYEERLDGSGRPYLRAVQEIVNPKTTLCGVSVSQAIETTAYHDGCCRACVKNVGKKRTQALQPLLFPGEASS